MSKKTTTITVFIVLVMMLFNSCAGVKEMAYFQKLTTKTDAVKQNTGLQDARIKPKDILSITVITSEPATSRIYNLTLPGVMQNSEKEFSTFATNQPALQSYQVDVDGNIDFPVFGKIKVIGLSLTELESLLQKKLEPAFSNERPIITIRFINFAIYVLGEVNRPGKFNTSNERMTIFDAISNAGDLTVYGRRDNIRILREDVKGIKKVITVNLNDENIIYSPFYYLEQNDVVYVEPNNVKSRSASFGAAESFAISAISIVISMTSLLINVLNK
ncbi:MAG: polysaccharide biosynthesis/export family protein [Bacteroidia bacterium]